MKWYIVVKMFLVVIYSIGPYDSKDECITEMIKMRDQAMSRYQQGERLNFMGKEIDPKKVKAQCQVK